MDSRFLNSESLYTLDINDCDINMDGDNLQSSPNIYMSEDIYLKKINSVMKKNRLLKKQLNDMTQKYEKLLKKYNHSIKS
tara:strand:- start:32 stop:271 length:240 start_codon:yes stop_codon:yes gene_type:complete